MPTETTIAVCADPRVELFVAQTEGPAERALLVVHGGPDWDHSYLREPLGQLAGIHRVIWPDLRGCGRSTVALPGREYNPGAVVSDLTALLDTLELPQVDLLGFSAGGLFAQHLVLAAPHRVRRLIIASSSILPVPEDAYDDWPEAAGMRAAANAAWAGNPEPTPQLVRAAAVAGIPASVWHRESREPARRRIDAIRFTAEWARSRADGTLPPLRPDDALRRLTELGTPLLLLHGRHDLTFPARLAECAADELDSADAVVLDQAGHLAHIDQPGPWLAAIAEFLG